MSAPLIIADIRSLLDGKPCFLAGSLVAEEAYSKTDAHSDVDLFVPTMNTLISIGQFLLDNGYKLEDRYDRVWARWLKYGIKGWHTNSLKLMSPFGVECNLVYKMTDGHPTTSLSQVLESFDFGLLGVGYDLESNTRGDLRPYLFPTLDIDGPLPLMPNKRDSWRNGFLSQYNGLREAGRYAKYHGYGYDLSLVKDDLVTGYWSASSYLSNHFDKDKQLLGKIYEVIALHIEADDIDHLTEASKELNYSDALDAIFEALE